MNLAQASALLIVATALLGACSSTPVAAPAPAPAPAAPAPAAAAAQVSTPSAAPAPVAASTVATVTLPAYRDPANPISAQRSVYFDFDDTAIKSEYVPVIERQGKYLAANPSLAIKIEGNTDERGSREYNLALGQKRAEAVLRALKIYGVKDSQMEPVSWGEDKPAAMGHDESAWAKNRRADLEYPQH